LLLLLLLLWWWWWLLQLFLLVKLKIKWPGRLEKTQIY
jgi:hypothetical protein